MPISRKIQIAFLVGAVLLEVIFTLASLLYVPWNSSAFLVVVLSALLSVSALILYVLVFDERMEEKILRP